MIAAPSVTVRPATESDEQAIGDLLVRAFNETYARKGFGIVMSDAREDELRNVSMRRHEGVVLVALHGEEVVGTVTLLPWGAPHSRAWVPGAADLRQLGVKPELHGNGVGPRLMDEAERLARTWKAAAICLHVRRGVTGVAQMYRTRGYARSPKGDLPLPDAYLEAYALKL